LFVNRNSEHVQVIRTGVGPRQISAPQTLTDIAVIDEFDYVCLNAHRHRL
jgi:hypothetical protein